MNILTYDIITKSSPNTKFSDAQIFLQEFAGKKFSKHEAEIIWTKILDHKWNMSEHLRRDVGLRVATIDYVEHFYQPSISKRRKIAITKSFFETLNVVGHRFRQYFEAKGKYSPFI